MYDLNECTPGVTSLNVVCPNSTLLDLDPNLQGLNQFYFTWT